MNELNLDNVNLFASYPVWQRGSVFVFTTDTNIEYSVTFDEEESFEYKSYWFNLTNLSHKKSHGDIKIAQIVICIIEEFFRVNPDILLYLCSTKGEQQAQRSRLFLRWFNGYEQQQKYYIKTAIVKGEGLSEYVSIILQRSHPHFDVIARRFDDETDLFNNNK